MKLISRGFALAVIVTVVVGCAAGREDSPTPGSAGATAGGSGTAGSAGAAGAAGSVGAGGAGGCVMPPVVKVSWMLMTGSDLSSPKLTCAQAGVKYVQFLLDTANTQFNCDDQKGMSTAFKAGMYTPRVLLTNAQNTIVFQGTGPRPVTVPTCGVADIGNFSFVVSPTGAGGSGGTAGAGGGGGTAGVSGGGGAGGSGGSTGTAGTGGGTGPCNALPIFAIHSCASPGACHDANGTSANFNMASPGWEKNLVGKLPKAGGAAGFASACVGSGMPYLVAGSAPARGLFLDKLASAKPACGLQMPLLPSYLSATELDCVQRWANALTKP